MLNVCLKCQPWWCLMVDDCGKATGVSKCRAGAARDLLTPHLFPPAKNLLCLNYNKIINVLMMSLNDVCCQSLCLWCVTSYQFERHVWTVWPGDVDRVLLLSYTAAPRNTGPQHQQHRTYNNHTNCIYSTNNIASWPALSCSVLL